MVVVGNKLDLDSERASLGKMAKILPRHLIAHGWKLQRRHVFESRTLFMSWCARYARPRPPQPKRTQEKRPMARASVPFCKGPLSQPTHALGVGERVTFRAGTLVVVVCVFTCDVLFLAQLSTSSPETRLAERVPLGRVPVP